MTSLAMSVTVCLNMFCSWPVVRNGEHKSMTSVGYLVPGVARPEQISRIDCYIDLYPKRKTDIGHVSSMK